MTRPAKVKEFPEGFMVHSGPVPMSLHETREAAEIAAARINGATLH